MVRSHHATVGGVPRAGGTRRGREVRRVFAIAADEPHVRTAGAESRCAGASAEVGGSAG